MSTLRTNLTRRSHRGLGRTHAAAGRCHGEPWCDPGFGIRHEHHGALLHRRRRHAGGNVARPRRSFGDFFGYDTAVSVTLPLSELRNGRRPWRARRTSTSRERTVGRKNRPSLCRIRERPTRTASVKSVAVEGKTIVRGVYQSNAANGAANVYQEGSSGWPTTPTTTISDPTATENDDLPSAVALSRSTLIFGEYEADGGIELAYIYAHGPSGWRAAPSATLPAPASSVHQFGESVATSGDTVIVTSFDARISGYVYTEASGIWPTTPTGTLTVRPVPTVVSMSGTTAVIGDFGQKDFEGLARIFEL